MKLSFTCSEMATAPVAELLKPNYYEEGVEAFWKWHDQLVSGITLDAPKCPHEPGSPSAEEWIVGFGTVADDEDSSWLS